MRLGQTVTLLLVLVNTVGIAAPGGESEGERQAPSFIELDKNGDGLVTRLEAVHIPQLAPRFDIWDRDNDGQLSRTEYQIGLLGRANQ